MNEEALRILSGELDRFKILVWAWEKRRLKYYLILLGNTTVNAKHLEIHFRCTRQHVYATLDWMRRNGWTVTRTKKLTFYIER